MKIKSNLLAFGVGALLVSGSTLASAATPDQEGSAHPPTLGIASCHALTNARAIMYQSLSAMLTGLRKQTPDAAGTAQLDDLAANAQAAHDYLRAQGQMYTIVASRMGLPMATYAFVVDRVEKDLEGSLARSIRGGSPMTVEENERTTLTCEAILRVNTRAFASEFRLPQAESYKW